MSILIIIGGKMRGIIRRMELDKMWGFIEGKGTGDYFFHAEDCNETKFFDLHLGEEVEFDFEVTKKGLRARNVRKIGQLDS